MNRKSPSTGQTKLLTRKPEVPALRQPLARREFQRAEWGRISGAVLCSVLTCVGAASQAQNAANPVFDPDQPDHTAPWPEAEKKGNWPPAGAQKPAAPKPTEPQPAATPTPVAAPEGSAMPAGLLDPIAMPAPPPTTRHELALSADYMMGQGTVTLPFGFSLGQLSPAITPVVVDADQDSTYIGATYSYSLGQAWYLDFAYSQGDTSGDFVNFNVGNVIIPTDFSIEDQWYQAYLRYTFPQLRGQRFQAYLRAGISFVQTELSVTQTGNASYRQRNENEDLYGNLGLGLSYSLYRKDRFRIRANADLEVFVGQRTYDISESITIFNTVFTTTDSFDSTVYGAFGKATIRFQYDLNESGLLRAFIDGGAQVKYTQIEYPRGLGNFDEILWGPYIKAGLLYSF